MKKRLTKSLMFVMILALMVTIAGCGGNGGGNGGEAADTVFTLRLGHAAAIDHPGHLASEIFKRDLYERSGGRLVVDIFPGGALGGERQLGEGVSIGTLELTFGGADAYSGWIPEWGLIGLPYLFDSFESVTAALAGEFGARLEELAIPHDMTVLGWGGIGFRQLSNDARIITSPDDMRGLMIRVMETPIHIALFNAFGANPTPLAFTELFTALQQGTVDAQDNPITNFYVMRFFEVQRYLTLTEHVYTALPLFINTPFLNSLPTDLQELIFEAGAEWEVNQLKFLHELEAEYLQRLIDAGITITTLTPQQKRVFMDMALEIYPDIYAEYGDELINIARSYNRL